jgi:predicted nucleic acid-binding protein
VSRRFARKYVVDTQLFINAFRETASMEALVRFHEDFAPFEYLSVIVAQELRAGVRSEADLESLDRGLLSLFERVGRIVTPSPAAWRQSGDVLAAMAKRDGLQLANVSKAFANDILLAASCREMGCVLITENVRDFARIRRFLQFDYITRWP